MPLAHVDRWDRKRFVQSFLLPYFFSLVYNANWLVPYLPVFLVTPLLPKMIPVCIIA